MNPETTPSKPQFPHDINVGEYVVAGLRNFNTALHPEAAVRQPYAHYAVGKITEVSLRRMTVEWAKDVRTRYQIKTAYSRAAASFEHADGHSMLASDLPFFDAVPQVLKPFVEPRVNVDLHRIRPLPQDVNLDEYHATTSDTAHNINALRLAKRVGTALREAPTRLVVSGPELVAVLASVAEVMNRGGVGYGNDGQATSTSPYRFQLRKAH